MPEPVGAAGSMSAAPRTEDRATRAVAAVCVPVRNEEEALPAALAALGDIQIGDADLVLCFFLDGCTDRSEEILRDGALRLPHQVEILQGERAVRPSAGRARRAAMAMGLARTAHSADAILLTTDADSRVHPGWLKAAIRGLAAADAVAGRVARTNAEGDPIQTRLERYYDRLHAHRRAIDPVEWEESPAHHFAGGANLAFRASVYRALGGFRPIASGEDAALLDDASRAGYRVRRDAAMLVETSSRRTGRAPGGLAAALRDIELTGMPRVSHPASADWQYRGHADARRAFARLGDAGARSRLGAYLGLDGDHVLGVGRDCPNAEAFAMRIVPAAPGGRDVPLPEAEAALARLEVVLDREAA